MVRTERGWPSMLESRGFESTERLESGSIPGPLDLVARMLCATPPRLPTVGHLRCPAELFLNYTCVEPIYACI